MNNLSKAVIFDLDGVITDTAEFHFLAWKRLAEEIGVPFTRADNEGLRGVPRRESLLRLLKGKTFPEDQMQELMARKNRYYQEMLPSLSPEDLLPGVAALLDQLDTAGIPYAIASASHNARTALERLGILHRLAALADGTSVKHQKPMPDLFRCAAAMLNQPPHTCLVVEDAEAGIEGGLRAGMRCLALGPAERFADLERRYGPIVRWDDLREARVEHLLSIGAPDPRWTIAWDAFNSAQQPHMETVFTIGNGYFCSRGSFEEGHPDEHALTLAHGIFDDMPISFTELANLPSWLDFALTVDGERFCLDAGHLLGFRQILDLRSGILRSDLRWLAPSGVLLDLTFERFASYAEQHLGALRVLITAVNQACQVEIAAGIDGHVANAGLLQWRHLDQGTDDAGAVWLHSLTRQSGIELAAAAILSTPHALTLTPQQSPGQPRLTGQYALGQTQTLQIDKLVSYATSRDPGEHTAGVVERAIGLLARQSYEALRAAQIAAWAALWDNCDGVIEGDAEAQLAIRFHLFQLLIAAPRAD